MKNPRMSDDETNDCSLWSNLPTEIIPNILSRLPLKSLCRFMSVSHSWKSLISSPSFAQTTNTNNPQKAILISSSNDFYSVNFADVNPTAEKLDFPLVEHSEKWFQLFSSCNGLVLISHGDKSDFLWNPFTREYKKLPESPFSELNPVHYGYYSYPHGIGYDSSTDDYKVVMLSCSAANTPTNVAVYSLKSDAWSRIQDSCFSMSASRGVYFNKRIHWFRRPCYLGGSCDIVAFDLTDEIFRVMQLPASFDTYKFLYHDMTVVGGCFYLIVGLTYLIEVWMMKEYGVRESWTRLIMIDNPRMSSVKLLSLLSKEDFLLFFFHGSREDDKLVVYNTKKETTRNMVVRGIPTKYTFAANYFENLVSLNHGGWMGMQCGASSGEPP